MPSHLNADDVITGDIERVNLNSAGAIHGREGATTAIEPLVVSSELSMEIEVEEIRTAPDPAKLIAAFAPSGEAFTLAARITGPIKSAFPDGPPEGVTSEAEHLAEAEAPLNLILVADADLLADAAWVREQDLLGQQIVIPIASNGDFAINALDNLSGSEGLISLRGRGLTDRPFTVVQAMQQDAEYKYRAKEQELLARLEETEAKIRALKEEEQQSGVILTAAQQDGDRELPRRDAHAAPGAARRAALAARERREPVDHAQGAQHLGGADPDRPGRGGARLVPADPRASRRGEAGVSAQAEIRP